MLATEGAGSRVRWEVLWVNPKTKRVERKQFGADHSGAVKLYVRVKSAGRKGATLRSMNMGFPPPDVYADREEVIVTVGGKRKKAKRMVLPRTYLVRMAELNLRGIWWCPYCCELRKFVYRKGFKLDGRFVPQAGMCCPMCHVSQTNWHVKHYNPAAATMEYREGKVSNPASQTDAAQRRRERRARRQRERQGK